MSISIFLTGGSPEPSPSTLSLFTLTVISTFPSPTILGVTSNFNTASLKDVDAAPSDMVVYGISKPCETVAVWLSKVKIFGFEITCPKPKFSNALISAFKTLVVVLFSTPSPLVPTISVLRISPAAAPNPPASCEVAPKSVGALPVPNPEIVGSPAFVRYAPILTPSCLSNSELAVTTYASINTCFVLTSISLITLSTTSKSFSLPLIIIDRVTCSSVICKVEKEFSPSPEENNSVNVALASAGEM